MTGTARQGARLKALDAMRRGTGGACPLRAHYVHNAPMKAPTFKTGIRFSRGKNRHAPLPPPLFKIFLIPNQSYTGWSFLCLWVWSRGGFKTGQANSISVNRGLKKIFARGFALLRSIWVCIRGRIKNGLTECLYCGLPKEKQRHIGDDYADMYRMGGKIRALDELARQEFIFFSSKNNPKLYHCGWFMSWQFRVAARYIRWGYLYYAVKDDNHDGK